MKPQFTDPGPRAGAQRPPFRAVAAGVGLGETEGLVSVRGCGERLDPGRPPGHLCGPPGHGVQLLSACVPCLFCRHSGSGLHMGKLRLGQAVWLAQT